jgi:hypothetical protein
MYRPTFAICITLGVTGNLMLAFLRFVVLLPLIVYQSITFAQQVPVTLDKLVSIERQRVLGLDKLTPEQRAGVVRLLQEAYQLGMQQPQGQEATTVPRAVPSPGRTGAAGASVIETNVDGEFKGWEGETIVKLMNGQIWQQTEYHYHYHYAYMPKVLIYRSGGGTKMKVDGVEKAVGVQQLK